MKPNNDDDFDIHESELADLFASLKQIQPTLTGQIQNRTTVARELARINSTVVQPARPWWQRPLSSAVPFATGVSLGILGALMFAVPNPDRMAVNQKHPTHPTEVRSTRSPDDLPPKAASNRPVDDQPVLDRYVTSTYVCGLGEVNTSSLYAIRETNQ